MCQSPLIAASDAGSPCIPTLNGVPLQRGAYSSPNPSTANSYPAAFSRHENHRIRWTPELDGLLGKLPDKAIAAQIGCTRESVTYRREKLGIPRCPQQNYGGIVAGKNSYAGKNKKALPAEVIEQLGKMPDYKLAAIAGVSKAVIAKRRKDSGILDYAEATGNDGKVKLGNVPKRWRDRDFVFSSACPKLPDDILAQLGKMPDSQLAEIVGVVPCTIARWRKELGIPSYRSTLGR